MEINEVITAISTVGFPIVMTLILLWLMNKNNEEHKSEVDSLKEAINNNTLVLNRLLEHFTEK